MGHSPYSPELAANDFSLFPLNKKKLHGERFSSREDIVGIHSIGVEKQTQMMVVHQNILSSVMPKNVKLYHANLRFHLATAEIT